MERISPHGHGHGVKPFKGDKKKILFFLRLICFILIVYGFFNEISHPNMIKLNNFRYGGCFEFLTHIIGVSTAFVIALGIVGDILKIRPYLHMYLVSIFLPAEIFITLISWFVFFAFPKALENPRARAFNAKEFHGFNNFCLHLVPFIGLMFDFITNSSYFISHYSQGIIIFLMSIAYNAWLIFLREKNGFWTYDYISKMSINQFTLSISLGYLISFGSWYFILPPLAKFFKEKDNLIGGGGNDGKDEFIGRKV